MPCLSRRDVLGAAIAAMLPMPTAGRTAQQDGSVWPVPTWAEADPDTLGVDPSLPSALATAAQAAPSVTGIVVTRAGHIVADYWAQGWSRDDPIDIRSCTKSVLGTLVGRARHDGLLPDLSITIGDLIPERIPAGADPGIAGITLRSLLTMTSGLAWDWQTDYPRLEAAGDPVGLTLGLPVVAPQGSVYVYNSGGSHLIGLMIAATAGMPLEAYAREALLEPLDIPMHGWRRTPQGEVIGGYGLRITPPDMARLGYLYLQGGEWNGEQLITTDYIEPSTIVQSTGDPTGGTPYGYQWWVTNTWEGLDAFYALGYGGQYIYVVPSRELVVAVAVGAIDVPLFPPRPIIEETINPLVYPFSG